MSVHLAYLGVIAIWSTTPLAIKLSNDSLAPLASLSLRIGLGFIGALLIGILLRGPALLKLKHWRTYLLASLSIFPSMGLVYEASLHIPSGLIAILFGLMPFFNGVLAVPLLGESFLTPSKVVALALSIIGLGVVFQDQLQANPQFLWGVCLVGTANLMFSISILSLKKVTQGNPVDALEQTTGSMLFALPGLLATWYFVDGNTNIQFSQTSLAALTYLVVFGSLLGFFAYFHILKHMEVSTISLIPLMTPVLAVSLGSLIGGEAITSNTLLGGALIVLALSVYQGHLTKLAKHLSKGSRQRGDLATETSTAAEFAKTSDDSLSPEKT